MKKGPKNINLSDKKSPSTEKCHKNINLNEKKTRKCKFRCKKDTKL